jgi:hypothetical protein
MFTSPRHRDSDPSQVISTGVQPNSPPVVSMA